MINFNLVEVNVKSLRELKREKDILEKKIKKLEDEIKEQMESNSIYEFEGEDWKVTWNMVAQNRFSQSLFKEDHPKLFEQYKVVSESRRFLLD